MKSASAMSVLPFLFFCSLTSVASFGKTGFLTLRQNGMVGILQRFNSITPHRMSLDYIKINAPGRQREQKIPTSFVTSFSKWIVNDGKLQPIVEQEALAQGWVDPISFEEVWLPLDLPAPEQRPAIAALTKDGSIRCIMPALDISVKDLSGITWRNRGLCSFPLARVWMDLHSADVSKLVLTAYTQVFVIVIRPNSPQTCRGNDLRASRTSHFHYSILCHVEESLILHREATRAFSCSFAAPPPHC
jgi:hypothetical protein